jgi:hypothetical protein
MNEKKQYKTPLLITTSFESGDVLSLSIGDGDYGDSWGWNLKVPNGQWEE